MQTLIADIRYALRQFRLAPVFTITAALTLALGIGGTTAIFSLIHAIMLRSLPVADPAALYRIGDGNGCCVNGGPQDNWSMVSFPLFERLKSQMPEFESLTAFDSYPHQIAVRRRGGDKVNQALHGEFVTGNYFSVLGIRSYMGRLLRDADDRASASPVAVISHRIWQSQYGGDPAIVGSTLLVDSHPFTVVGIAPPGFFGETLRSDPPDIWLPLQQEPLVRGKNSLLRQSVAAWLRVIGRLRPGANVDGMSARLTALLRQWLIHESGWPVEFMPEVKGSLNKQFLNVVPAGSGVMIMKEDYGRTLYVLLTVCCLVLAIACANIANLMLARGMVRRGDISLRMALGASRGRLIRQSLTESVVLALIGGLLGVFVADGATRLILALSFDRGSVVPIDPDASWPVLAFALGASILTGVLFGTAPAWFATRTQPVEALRGVNRSTGDRSSIPQKTLLVVQATLSIVLIAGASMLTRSLGNLENQKFGFDTNDRVAVYINPAPSTYTAGQLDALYRNLLSRFQEVKGVERAGLALYTPFTDNRSEDVYIQGRPRPSPNSDNGSSWDRITPGYFATAGQTLIRGRAFDDHDRTGSAPVAIVNQAFINKFIKGEDPIGQHFGIDLPAEAGRFQIVGVVRDAKYTEPNAPARPMFFLPLAQQVDYANDLLAKLQTRSSFVHGILLKTGRGIASLEPEVRKLCSDVDPNITVIDVNSMQEQVAMNFNQQRAVASLASLFGAVALLLAAVASFAWC